MRCRDHEVYTRSRNGWNHFSGPSREFQGEEKNTFLLHLLPIPSKGHFAVLLLKLWNNTENWMSRWQLDLSQDFHVMFTTRSSDEAMWSFRSCTHPYLYSSTLKWESLQQLWFQSWPSSLITHHWENKLGSGACILNPATVWLPHVVPKCLLDC